jgi:integrase
MGGAERRPVALAGVGGLRAEAHKPAQRRRRIPSTEEAPLLTAAGELTRGAGLRLQWLIIAAIETGARLGELLNLTWADVDLDNRTLLIRAVDKGAKKTGRSRKLPVSTRLAAILEMASTDPAGRHYGATQFVFGALGARVASVDKAWMTAVLRAHGHEPAWTRTGALTPGSRDALNAIDLHFHDLRHEAGCRWLEAGWPLHHVREMLGHANLSETSTYLHASEDGLAESMRQFDAARGKPVANEVPTENRPVSHDDAEDSTKGLLH